MEKRRQAMMERLSKRGSQVRKAPKPLSKSDQMRQQLKTIDLLIEDYRIVNTEVKNAEMLTQKMILASNFFNSNISNFPKRDLCTFLDKLKTLKRETGQFSSKDIDLSKININYSSKTFENSSFDENTDTLSLCDNNSIFRYSEKSSESITITRSKGKHVILENLKDCVINLQEPSSSLMIKHCYNIKISNCFSESSIYLNDVEDSQLQIGCSQLRLKACSNLNIEIFLKVKTVLEASKNIRFKPTLIGIFEKFLNSTHISNNWKNIDDFDNPLELEPLNFSLAS